jgi:transposase InsO family protein
MDWPLALGFLLGWVTCAVARACTPTRLIQWHDALYRTWWRWKSKRRGGRPRINPELIALIRRMARENPLWGAPRIHGELLKLGFKLAQSTVSKYMPARDERPSQSWSKFLATHAEHIVGIDMLTVRTLGFDTLYAFVVLGHGRRRILHVEVARQPNAYWLACEIARTLGNASIEAPILVRDNDRHYGAVFRRQLRAVGVRDHPTQPHSPWQNGHVERLIGSIRRECLDHQIILSAAHLRRVLRGYADYYNFDRTHLALGKDCPIPRPTEPRGRIISRRVLGGLHRRYARGRSK